MNIAISYADLRSEHCYRNRKTFSSKKVYLSVVREREREIERDLAKEKDDTTLAVPKRTISANRSGTFHSSRKFSSSLYFIGLCIGVVGGYRERRKGGENMKGVGKRRTKVI